MSEIIVRFPECGAATRDPGVLHDISLRIAAAAGSGLATGAEAGAEKILLPPGLWTR